MTTVSLKVIVDFGRAAARRYVNIRENHDKRPVGLVTSQVFKKKSAFQLKF